TYPQSRYMSSMSRYHFCLHTHRHHQNLHSFPTRRSSDLWVAEKYRALTGGTILEAYGQSEATGATHCVPFPAGGPEGSIGKPLRSEEHTSELQSRENLVCRLLLEKKKNR